MLIIISDGFRVPEIGFLGFGSATDLRKLK